MIAHSIVRFQGTRPTGAADHETMVRAVIDVGADGFNGDTMPGINTSFMEVASKLGKPLAFEPEFGMDNISDLAQDVLSWGYWNYTPSASLASPGPPATQAADAPSVAPRTGLPLLAPVGVLWTYVSPSSAAATTAPLKLNWC